MEKKTTKKEQRRVLINKIIELEAELQYCEYRIPDLLFQLKKLNPTKKELDDNGLRDLFNIYI